MLRENYRRNMPIVCKHFAVTQLVAKNGRGRPTSIIVSRADNGRAAFMSASGVQTSDTEINHLNYCDRDSCRSARTFAQVGVPICLESRLRSWPSPWRFIAKGCACRWKYRPPTGICCLPLPCGLGGRWNKKLFLLYSRWNRLFFYGREETLPVQVDTHRR